MRIELNGALYPFLSKLFFLVFFVLVSNFSLKAQSAIYEEGFEGTHGWTLTNGLQTNRWFVGTVVNNGGTRSLYISNNASGTNNEYSNTISVVHAYRDIAIPAGVTQAAIYFDWRANGDIAGNDYLRTWLVPNSFTPTAGTAITTGSGRILLNTKLNRDNTWKTQFNENVNVSSFTGTSMRLVFEWINDGTTVTQNAAAVDNVRVLRYCTGVPTGGTTALTATNGAPSTVFNASVTGSSVAAGISYQWQISNSATGPWADISGAITANVTLTAVPLPGTTRFYRRKIICSLSSQEAFSTAVSFTTTSPSYCTPTAATPAGLHISNVKIYGMSVTPVNNTTTHATNGYSSFTGNPALIARQAQGEGVNIEASVSGTDFGRGRWKAWVDWNGDGDFDDVGEEVYNVGGIVAGSLNFGFQIPVNQTPGNYRMRIRVNNGLRYNFSTGAWQESNGTDYTPCGNFTNGSFFADRNGYGETEDYFITVIENCAAKIATVNAISECLEEEGVSVSLTATSNVPVTEFRWYTSESGTGYVSSAPDGTGMATTWDTPLITTSTLYYVTAFNGACESTFRTEVKADIKPTPTVSFTPSTFEVCGISSVIEVSATGGNETVHLVNENFEGGNLGVFTNQVIQGTFANANFSNRTSVFKPTAPPFMSWLPAISSGFGSNRFVLTSSDFNAGMTLHRGLISSVQNTNEFLNLTLKFRMFFSRYYADNTIPADEYAAIQITNNGGTTWTELERFTADVGIATRFVEKTYNLDAYINQNIQFRFVMYSFTTGVGWLATGLAIDDVELYGEKPLEPSFDWVSDNAIGIYTDPEGTIEYNGESLSTLYIKPTIEQIEDFESWDITATAMLDNGCEAEGTVNILNNTRVWNDVTTNWNVNNWLPNNTAPTLDQCVVVRTPVNLGGGVNGLAKSILIQENGRLTIEPEASLTVSDEIINEAGATNFIVESDANLLQINPIENIGEITVHRSARVPSNQYNYWTSPVSNQLLYNLYPGIPSGKVMIYNTSTDYFTVLPLNTNPISEFGKGYSIKGSNQPAHAPDVTANFIGVPQNESLTSSQNRIPLSSVGNRFNLIGNPFPSNLNLDQLYNHAPNSGAFDGTYYFWDNTYNTIYHQQGSGYTGNNYAIYNVNSGGVPASGGNTAKEPNGIVKPGQGFIVQALPGASQLVVTNAMRTKEVKINAADEDAPYYKNGDNNFSADTNGSRPRNDKFWLELVTPGEVHIRILMGYFAQAENTFEKFDTKVINENVSDNIYSFSKEAFKLAIQGRVGPFAKEDIIPLGAKFFVNGTYKIQLNETRGIFKAHQDIYVKDKYLNQIHNLSKNGAYEFAASKGEFTDRFEIVYQRTDSTKSDLADTQQNRIDIFKQEAFIVVKSNPDKVKTVEIFNLTGRSIYQNKKVNRNEISIPSAEFGKQILFLKVETERGEIHFKKIINKE